MINVVVGVVVALVGFCGGVVVANQTNSKAEAELIKTYNIAVQGLLEKLNEARSRVAKRRRLKAWDYDTAHVTHV